MSQKDYRKNKGRSIEELEKLNFNTLDLYSDISIVKENILGNQLQWYGKRLIILRHLYNKSASAIATLLHVTLMNISNWERNISKPSDKEIKKLCFLFEVPDNFFSEDTVNLIIKQQLKINI
jgi:DNA-binding transcriptional regulator YiaG